MRPVRFVISPHFSGSLPAQHRTSIIQTLPRTFSNIYAQVLTKISGVGARNPTCQLISTKIEAPQ